MATARISGLGRGRHHRRGGAAEVTDRRVAAARPRGGVDSGSEIFSTGVTRRLMSGTAPILERADHFWSTTVTTSQRSLVRDSPLERFLERAQTIRRSKPIIEAEF